MPIDTRLDYFYPNEAEQFSFYRIPKASLQTGGSAIYRRKPKFCMV